MDRSLKDPEVRRELSSVLAQAAFVGLVGGVPLATIPWVEGTGFAWKAPVASLVGGAIAWVSLVVPRARVSLAYSLVVGAVMVALAHAATWVLVGVAIPSVSLRSIDIVKLTFACLVMVGVVTVPCGMLIVARATRWRREPGAGKELSRPPTP